MTIYGQYLFASGVAFQSSTFTCFFNVNTQFWGYKVSSILAKAMPCSPIQETRPLPYYLFPGAVSPLFFSSALHTTENLPAILAICPVSAMCHTAGPPTGCFSMPIPDGRLPTNPSADNVAVLEQFSSLSQFFFCASRDLTACNHAAARWLVYVGGRRTYRRHEWILPYKPKRAPL